MSPELTPVPSPGASAGVSPADLANFIAAALVVVTALGILVSILLVFAQLRRQWLLHSSEIVTDFEKRWVSDEWRAFRRKCAVVIQGHWSGEPLTLSEDFEVLGMLEHLALLCRRRLIDFELVWNKFGWYYIRYYEALTGGPVDAILAVRERENDRTLWEELEWMYGRCAKEYARRGVRLMSDEEGKRVQQLLQQELNLRGSSEVAVAPPMQYSITTILRGWFSKK